MNEWIDFTALWVGRIVLAISSVYGVLAFLAALLGLIASKSSTLRMAILGGWYHYNRAKEERRGDA